jgi:hypothetical protein
MQRWPGRTMIIDFDALCMRPRQHCITVAKFLGVELADQSLSEFCDFVRSRSDPRSSSVGLGQFASCDLTYVANLGYTL